MWMIPTGLALLILGVAAYVRLAPTDPEAWHVALTPSTTVSTDCATSVVPGKGSATAACRLPGTPVTVLEKLDAIAMATPRTQRLAGSPQDGRITWITRSKLWGFPDYTTAQAQEIDGQTQIDILGRLRFGREDMGVNAARLTEWLTTLAKGG